MSVALIAGIILIVLIVAVALKQRSGTRITRIERRRRREEDDDA